MLLGFEMEPLPTWAAEGGLGVVAIYAAYQVGRVASKLSKFLEDESKRRERADSHMKAEREHWKVEEELLRQAAPRPVFSDHTPPVHRVPVTE